MAINDFTAYADEAEINRLKQQIEELHAEIGRWHAEYASVIQEKAGIIEAMKHVLCGDIYKLGSGFKLHICIRPKDHEGEHAGQGATW